MKSVSVNLVGDFCVDKFLESLRFGNRLHEQLSNADYNVVNMEGPIKCDVAKSINKSGPNLFQEENVPTFLEQNKFNIIGLANNHIMDYGRIAAEQTIQRFVNALTLGCGIWENAYSVEYVESNNITIGLFAITQHEFGVLDDISYSQKSFGTAWLLHPIVDEIITEAKMKCDFLIITPHAGLENFCLPLPELRTLYRHFVQMGADAVVACHPHTPQCWEIYKEKPIVYSLGNFCFNAIQNNGKYWNDGLLAHLSFEKDTINNQKNVSLNIKTTHFDNVSNTVDISVSKELNTYLDNINSIFRDEERYIKAIECKCMEISFMYDLWFEKSGYIRPQIVKYFREIIKRLYSKIKNNSFRFDETYLVNNLRCETHRWVLSRIYEINCKKNKELSAQMFKRVSS